jgi:D-beta-D-heptose 7-phosphate kinase/D-beta-D-heptose 1-phosphate adenosyltransferase
MLDEYVWGDAGRISPEAPVPVVEVSGCSVRLGGAANVARNVVSLGGKVHLLSVVGADDRAGKLREVLDEEGILPDGLVEDADRPTSLKTRIIAGRQQVVRVDRESRASLTGAVREEFDARLSDLLAGVDGVIVSDYGKGIVDLPFMERLIREARERDVPVAVDPKESHFHRYAGVSIVTPNANEAGGAARVAIVDEESLARAGRVLLSELGAEGVLITRGAEGMSLFRPDCPPVHIPATAREVFDVTGAGDTVVAAFTMARAAGGSMEAAAVLSNAAAGIVVGELGTACVSPEALLSAVGASPAGAA